MGNVLHVIFRYFIDTQARVVRVERLLLHKGVANNVLPTAIACRSVPCTHHSSLGLLVAASESGSVATNVAVMFS